VTISGKKGQTLEVSGRANAAEVLSCIAIVYLALYKCSFEIGFEW